MQLLRPRTSYSQDVGCRGNGYHPRTPILALLADAVARRRPKMSPLHSAVNMQRRFHENRRSDGRRQFRSASHKNAKESRDKCVCKLPTEVIWSREKKEIFWTENFVDWLYVVGCMQKRNNVNVELKVRVLAIALVTWVDYDQQRFAISEVAADWHELMIPRRIMRPSIARSWEQLDPRCSPQTYHLPDQPH